MLDLWEILILASAAASCVAVAVSLGVLRRLVSTLEHRHGAAEHDHVPFDAGGVSVGTQLPDFVLHDPVPEGTADAPNVSFYSLLEVPRVVVLTRHGCPGCETLIKALSDSRAPVAWMNIVVVIDPETAVDGLLERATRRGVRFLVQQESAASTAFQHRASPQAFAVSEDGVVVDKRVTDGVDELVALAADALQLRPSTGAQPTSSNSVAPAQQGREVIR